MPIYIKPVWGLMHDMANDFKLGSDRTFQKQDAIQWFAKKYPLIKSNTVTAHLTRMSTNAQSRPYYKAKPGNDDLFYKIDSNTFRLYDPENDPIPIYELSDDKPIKKRSLSYKVHINKFNIKDEQLKNRMARLGSAPSDTIIREAGVVLENRLREVGRVKKSLVGAKLVDHVFEPPDGLLLFSTHPGEQDGVRMLYRGAMQFIRNPPMHKLIDYTDQATQIFLTLIDSLLQLLSELNPHHRDDVSLEQVCEMLRLGEISLVQKELFRVLLSTNGEWISAEDLAVFMEISRKQLSGILGSLGKRVNRTPGIENMGGLMVILDRKKEGGEIYYRMRKILRDALEKLNIL